MLESVALGVLMHLGAVGLFFPVLLTIELPVYLAIIVGLIRDRLTPRPADPRSTLPAPTVSCIITCYNEGACVEQTVTSLMEQTYRGSIEILAVVDGAADNTETLAALKRLAHRCPRSSRRRMMVIPKWQRGGRVSSLNTGLYLSRGHIVMALDGDTSFDNDMVANAVQRMANPNVIALTGTLRPRNHQAGLWTRLQALEYLIGLLATRTGLSAFNVINNISGAFGVFRRDALLRVGGWECGTAEDLDLTLRLKRYGGRNPGQILAFEPTAVAHTDVPETLTDLLRQRLRWDGDLYYMYARKHRSAFSPDLLGWPNMIATVWYGLIHQVALPFVIAGYLVWLVLLHPPAALLTALGVVYVIYLAITMVLGGLAVALLSERRRSDLPLLAIAPVYPVYRGLMRLWSVVALLAEIILHQHKDTSMAPWWVLKRSQY